MKSLLFFLCIFSLQAVVPYEAGKTAAIGSVQSLQGSLKNPAAITDAGVPITDRPPEAVIYDKDKLQKAASCEKGKHEGFKTVHESQKDRLDYTFDLDVDLQKAEASEAFEVVEDINESQTLNKTCRRSGTTYTQSCKRERIVTIEVIPEQGYHTPRFCLGHWKGKYRRGKKYCNPPCRGGEYIITRPKSIKILRDEWQGCEVEETLRDEGAAELEEVRAGPIENPRLIQGEPISGDIWEETRLYRIGTNTFDQCASLKALGCTDQGGRCIKTKTLNTGQVICLEYEHIFECRLGSSKTRRPRDLKIPTTEYPSYEGNKNMAESLARIEALKQAAKSMETKGSAVISIFKGEDRRCTTNFGGDFKDCCKKSGGIGVRMGLATECKPDEQELAEWRMQGRCVFVGQRQKNDMFGMNLSKEYVYCCFPSRLARAIQQGGRAQLRIDWGTAERPSCCGLTPAELQRLDWSRLDLSEVFEEMARSAEQTAKTLQRDYAQKHRALSSSSEKNRRQDIQEKALKPTGEEASHDLAY
jgi:hypothetical protein